MKVLDPGHLYELQTIDPLGPLISSLRFVKREGPNYPGNKGTYPGTIIQDVLRCCIDRLRYLDKQKHCDLNWLCINLLRQVLFILELRAAQMHKRSMPPIRLDIEVLATAENGHLLAWQEPTNAELEVTE